jgi:hypothetical protein
MMANVQAAARRSRYVIAEQEQEVEASLDMRCMYPEKYEENAQH